MKRGGAGRYDPDAEVKKPLKFSIGSDDEEGAYPTEPLRSRTSGYQPDDPIPPSLPHIRIIRWLLRMFPRVVLVLFVAALVIAMLPGGWRVALCAANLVPPPALRLGENVTLIGHRGCEFPYPENTIKALRYGADMLGHVELDLGLTSDGDVIVIHDDTLDRTTNGTGNTCEVSTKYVKSLLVKMPERDPTGRIAHAKPCYGKTSSGQSLPCKYRVPLLGEVFDALPKHTKYIIDIKECYTPGVEKRKAECTNCTRLMKATKDAMMKNFVKPEQLTFSSLEPASLKIFQDNMPPGSSYALTLNQKHSHYKRKTVLQMLAAGNFSHAAMYVGLASVRPDLVRAIREAPLQNTMKHRDVYVWTVRRDLEFRLARCSGASNLIVADPKRMLKKLAWDVGSLLADDS